MSGSVNNFILKDINCRSLTSSMGRHSSQGPRSSFRLWREWSENMKLEEGERIQRELQYAYDSLSQTLAQIQNSVITEAHYYK